MERLMASPLTFPAVRAKSDASPATAISTTSRKDEDLDRERIFMLGLGHQFHPGTLANEQERSEHGKGHKNHQAIASLQGCSRPLVCRDEDVVQSSRCLLFRGHPGSSRDP